MNEYSFFMFGLGLALPRPSAGPVSRISRMHEELGTGPGVYYIWDKG
ncbi:Phenylacetyl-CoA:acceptor oxidoreductase [Aromatoleum bremense]|nr:Phenylacetyl-CoA:acceptor oxidoreductase [Aromatoleum bremense]